MTDSGNERRRVLILGGTGEALALAAALAGDRRIETITSLAGRTRVPAQPAGRLRVGGFGGLNGMLDYLRAERIAALVDATHPFATQIGSTARRAAWAAGVPLLRLERPAWPRHPDDLWIEVDDARTAAALAPRHGARALLTVGARELRAFAGIESVWFLVRLIEDPGGPLPLVRCELLIGRGPFSAAAELRLLEERRIDMVIAKNSGGDATYGKIAAARALGLPVILLRRPPSPPEAGETAATVVDAARWVLDRLVANLGT